jgi:hypothetical protein
MAQVVEYLLYKHQTLNSNPSPIQKEKEKNMAISTYKQNN